MMNFAKAQEIFKTFYPNGIFEMRDDMLVCSTNTYTYHLNGNVTPRYDALFRDFEDTEEFYCNVLYYFNITVYSECEKGRFNVQFGEGTEWAKV